MNKTTFGVLVGNIVEFYDFILFGYLSVYLSNVFFPNHDPYIGMLITFSIFASGCIVRPIGALFFGHLGDTLGRKSALKLSIIIASISTASVGVLPSYQSVGILAPCLLILCRLSQGFSICGEETGAAIYLIESKPKSESGYASSLVLASVYGGLAFGSGVVFIITWLLQDHMASFGWRIPFLLAAPMGYIAYKLRGSAKESPVFEKLRQQKAINKQPLLSIFSKNKKSLLTGILNCALLAIAIYMFAVYFPSQIQDSIYSKTIASGLVFSVTLLTALACPIMGRLTDMYGTWKMYKLSILIFTFLSLPVLHLVTQPSIFQILIGYTALGLMCSTLTGTMFATLAASFTEDIRYSGVTLAFNLSMTIFGSTAPMVALWLSHRSFAISLLPLQLIGAAALAYLGFRLSTHRGATS